MFIFRFLLMLAGGHLRFCLSECWAKEFDHADNDTKKMILARLIERIDVDRDYHLTIKFFVTIEEFKLSQRMDQALPQSCESDPSNQAIAV